LGSCRHQRIPILERPTVVLRIRKLQAIGAEGGCQLDDLANSVKVGAV
jgi:hypothetical protein